MNEANVTGAITDLIAGVILIPMIIALCFKKAQKNREKKLWIYFLSFFALSCFLGFVNHYFFTGIVYKVVWIPLYIFLFETVNAFFILAGFLYSGKSSMKKEFLTLQFLSLAILLVIELLEWSKDVACIRIYVVYAAIVGIIGFVLVVMSAFKKGRTAERILLSSMIPLIPAAYFQIDRSIHARIIFEFNCDGLTHLGIIISMLIIFTAAYISLSQTPTCGVNTRSKKPCEKP